MDSLSKITLPTSLIKVIGEIDEFKGRWEALGNLAPERMSALRRIATIESVGSSTRIEGVKLANREIEQLLSGIDIRSFRSRDEQEVAGYADLMEIIFDSYDSIPVSENTIRQLHGILLQYADKDQRHRGKYKTLPNNVEAFDENGKSLGIIFETATAFDTPRKMEALISMTVKGLQGANHHALLVIAEFVVRFLAIHPFQDGNGRLSRALTTLLLLQSGYLYAPYSSLERIIEESKDEYYKALRSAQSTLDRDEFHFTNWLHFFLMSLRKQKDVLDRKVKTEHLMAPLSPLSERIYAIVTEHGKVTVREAASITGASRNTIKDHMGKLIEAGHLIRHGRGRGTWYEKP